MASVAMPLKTGCRAWLPSHNPCRHGGGASVVVESAPHGLALVPAGTCLSQQLPFQSLLNSSSRFSVRIVTCRKSARTEARAGKERLLPKRAPQGDAQSFPESTADSGTERESTQRIAPPPSSGVVDSNNVVKTCTQCKRSKVFVDFEKTVVTVDGRTDECRACLAVVRAQRARKALHHLALSVEESWERAKRCTKCGLVKEFRDFSRRVRNKDGTYGCCRACHSDIIVRARRQGGPHSPTDEPQRCSLCLEVKEADHFFPDGGQLTGRKSVCKTCFSGQKAEQYQTAKEVQIHVWKATRRCWTCQQEKPRSEFYRRPLSIEGLSSNCIACLRIYEKTRHEMGKERGPLDG